MLSLLLRTTVYAVDMLTMDSEAPSGLWSLLSETLIFMATTSITIDNLFLLCHTRQEEWDCLGQRGTVTGHGGFRVLRRFKSIHVPPLSICFVLS